MSTGHRDPAPPSLRTSEPGLLLSPLPVWVFDPDAVRVCWANDPALALWRAPSRAELFARDLLADAPASVRARLHDQVTRVRAGERLVSEWSFYPDGRATTVSLHMHGITLDDGRLVILNQAAPLAPEAAPAVLRSITAIRHLPALVAFVSLDGVLRMHNPAAIAEFGEGTDYAAWFRDPGDARRLLLAARDGEVVRAEAAVRGRDGERWHSIEAHRLRDPVVGDFAVLLLHRDETARRTAESAAAAHRLHIAEQHQQILALSAPILLCGAHTLVVPIIGRLDDERGRELTGRLLPAIGAQRTRRVIVDMTGVADVDLTSARRLRELLAAVQLLGAAPVLTGFQPALAATLVAAGIDLHGVQIHRSLAEALAPA